MNWGEGEISIGDVLRVTVTGKTAKFASELLQMLTTYMCGCICMYV